MQHGTRGWNTHCYYVDALDAKNHDTILSQVNWYLGIKDQEADMVKRKSKHPFPMTGNKIQSQEADGSYRICSMGHEDGILTATTIIQKEIMAQTPEKVANIAIDLGTSQEKVANIDLGTSQEKVANIDLGTSVVVAVEISGDTAKVVASFPALYDLKSRQQVDALDAENHDTIVSQVKRYLGIKDMVKRESKHPFPMTGNKSTELVPISIQTQTTDLAG
ncbi:hypothetical protein ACHWQZ_G001905 [Mnemiopsis leidyi]